MNVTVSKGTVTYKIDTENTNHALDEADNLYNERAFDIQNVEDNGDVLEITSFADMLSALNDIASEITMNGEYYSTDDETTEIIFDISKLSKKIDNYLK